LDEISDAAWRELSDPLNFVVGAVLLTFAALKHGGLGRTDGLARAALSAFRLFGTLGVAAIVALPVLIGEARPKLDTGNPTIYALTLLVGGAITLVPGRIRELRRPPDPELDGLDYPKRLRALMWIVELVLVVGGIVLIALWGFGGAGKNDDLRAVVWGAISVSLADFLTLIAAVNFATAKSAVEAARRSLPQPHAPAAPAG
jgi:hypothetical protein